jgi:hypothetical protein
VRVREHRARLGTLRSPMCSGVTMRGSAAAMGSQRGRWLLGSEPLRWACDWRGCGDWVYGV